MKNFAKYYFDIVGKLTIGEEDGKLTDLHGQRNGKSDKGILFHSRFAIAE